MADTGIYQTAVASPVGTLVLSSSGQALTSITFDAAAQLSSVDNPVSDLEDDAVAPDPATRAAIGWLRAYFDGDRPQIEDVPLEPQGSAFQKRVWLVLRRILYGTTRSYGSIAGEVAQELGKERMAAQAIGGAVGRNPLPIIVPCHRVIGARGQLTGYAGGLGRKMALLHVEGVDTRLLASPR